VPKTNRATPNPATCVNRDMTVYLLYPEENRLGGCCVPRWELLFGEANAFID
jgi:hypothetical protein